MRVTIIIRHLTRVIQTFNVTRHCTLGRMTQTSSGTCIKSLLKKRARLSSQFKFNKKLKSKGQKISNQKCYDREDGCGDTNVSTTSTDGGAGAGSCSGVRTSRRGNCSGSTGGRRRGGRHRSGANLASFLFNVNKHEEAAEKNILIGRTDA
jgi:hypothetical protein